jgi:hypothetical protein
MTQQTRETLDTLLSEAEIAATKDPRSRSPTDCGDRGACRGSLPIYHAVHPRVRSIKRIVPATETRIDPPHPSREEKNPNTLPVLHDGCQKMTRSEPAYFFFFASIS